MNIKRLRISVVLLFSLWIVENALAEFKIKESPQQTSSQQATSPKISDTCWTTHFGCVGKNAGKKTETACKKVGCSWGNPNGRCILFSKLGGTCKKPPKTVPNFNFNNPSLLKQ